MKISNPLILLSLLICFFSCKPKAEFTTATYVNKVEAIEIDPKVNLKRAMDSLRANNVNVGLYVSKKHQRMAIMARGRIVKSYPVVFGRNPIDDKLMQGDRCTPEGRFKVKAKYPHRAYNKFIWIDYPNAGSWKKHNYAKSTGSIPQTASIGGEIGLHGITENDDWMIDSKVNWTYGCISMKNEHMNEIYPYIINGMDILIVK